MDKSHLGKLPVELRLQIYEYVLISAEPIEVRLGGHPDKRKRRRYRGNDEDSIAPQARSPSRLSRELANSARSKARMLELLKETEDPRGEDEDEDDLRDDEDGGEVEEEDQSEQYQEYRELGMINRDKHLWGLTLTCREIRRESMPVLLANNRFHIPMHSNSRDEEMSDKLQTYLMLIRGWLSCLDNFAGCVKDITLDLSDQMDPWRPKQFIDTLKQVQAVFRRFSVDPLVTVYVNTWIYVSCLTHFVGFTVLVGGCTEKEAREHLAAQIEDAKEVLDLACKSMKSSERVHRGWMKKVKEKQKWVEDLMRLMQEDAVLAWKQ